jgi:hypothetical protein
LWLPGAQDDVTLAVPLYAQQHLIRLAESPAQTSLDVSNGLDRKPIHLADDIACRETGLRRR